MFCPMLILIWNIAIFKVNNALPLSTDAKIIVKIIES